jgi:hypothetical protein
VPDPFETLRHRDPEEVPVDRLPADEVRRRGDARRRRRTTLQGAAATLAVAAVVGGVAFGTGAVDSTAPDPPPASQGPTPTPEPTEVADPSPTRVADPDAVTAIPPGFPLADGYPEDTGADTDLQGPGPEVEAFTEMTACDRTLQLVPPEDRLAATFSQPEDYRARELTTYASAAGAADQVARIVDLYQACPRETYEASPDTVVEVVPGTLGDASYSIVRRGEMDGGYVPGMEVIVAVQVGNAVLLSSESHEGGASPASVRSAQRQAEDRVVGLVDAMCVFTTDGCATGEPAGPADLLALADAVELTGFATDWTETDEALETDDCRTTVPASLLAGPLTAVRYEGHSRDDPEVVNARLASAVASFPSAEAAADAFDAAREDILGCGEGRSEVASKQTGTSYWRMLGAPAPEVCTQCGAAWLHATGVALVDDRVVALNLSWIGDLETIVGADDPAPVSRVLSVAADLGRPRT